MSSDVKKKKLSSLGWFLCLSLAPAPPDHPPLPPSPPPPSGFSSPSGELMLAFSLTLSSPVTGLPRPSSLCLFLNPLSRSLSPSFPLHPSIHSRWLSFLPLPPSFLSSLLSPPQPLSNRPTCFLSLIAWLLPVNGDTKSAQSAAARRTLRFGESAFQGRGRGRRSEWV